MPLYHTDITYDTNSILLIGVYAYALPQDYPEYVFISLILWTTDYASPFFLITGNHCPLLTTFDP